MKCLRQIFVDCLEPWFRDARSTSRVQSGQIRHPFLSIAPCVPNTEKALLDVQFIVVPVDDIAIDNEGHDHDLNPLFIAGQWTREFGRLLLNSCLWSH
jgi:hypothetical protein